MITIIKSADNSGFKKIKHLGYIKNTKNLNINNICVSLVKKCAKLKKFVRKSDIIKTLIVRLKKYSFNLDTGTKFYNNASVLIDIIEFTRTKRIRIKATKITGLVSSMIKPYIYKSKLNLKKTKFI
uniref:Ribosomal protein L14 n=1 Tax=Babesia duncani TaxID=323732 RepID=A0A385GNJ3_9APIC|nr:ribosomal protein L14 [Babesia duncani]